MILWNPSSALFLGLGLGNLALQAEATLRASSQEHRELHKKKKKYSKASPWPDLPDIIVPTPGDGDDGGDEDCATRANDTPEKIMECIELEALREHHRVWQGYADDGDGTRYWNTLACDQTAFYIGNMLEAYGYNVTYQLFGQSQYQEDPEKPAIVYSVALDKYFENAKIPELGDDFATYLYSGSGKIQAPIQAIGYIDPDTLGDGESESGCTVEQFEAEGFVPGNIAMLQRGTCSTETKAENAEAAGASAVIIFNEGTPGRENLRAVSGLDLVPYLVHIPVIGASHHMAAELIAVEGTEVYLEVNGVTFPGRTFNVIAETYGGDPENVLVLGGHMDSEILGAGINDDASGLTALLEVAKQAANIEPLNKLRFCFWAAEEIGLVGSTHYVQSLTEEEIASIFLYINADMIASPNYALYIETLDGEGGDGPFEIVTEYYEKYGIPWERGFGGTCFTDMCEFNAVGIQYADIYTGSSETMSEEQAIKYGGVAGEPHDACYHLNCDNYNNIDEDILLINARGIGYMVIRYAFLPDPPRSASGRRRRRRTREESEAVKAEVMERYGSFKERKIR